MSNVASKPRSISEHLRWIAPLISILIFAPITIYEILASTDLVKKVLFGIGLAVCVLLMMWWLILEWRRRDNLRTKMLMDEVIQEKLAAPIESLKNRVEHFEAEEAFRYLSTVYGWGYEFLDVTGTIGHDGSMRLERVVTVHADRLLDRLPQSLNVQPTKIENPDRMANVRVTSRTEGIRTPDVKIVPLTSGWVADFSISPPLQAGQKLSFDLIEDVPSGIYQVRVKPIASPQPGEQFDWLNWRIDRPTRRLALTVVFPRGYQPRNVQVRVFYQPLPNNPDDGRPHEDEEKRAQELLTRKKMDGLDVVTLNIELPVLGLIYMIAWNPLE